MINPKEYGTISRAVSAPPHPLLSRVARLSDSLSAKRGGVRRFVFFGMVSTLGALIDFAIGWSLIRAGFAPAIALAGAMCVSATLLYVIHQRLTFADIGGRELAWKRLAAFIGSTVMIYLFRLALYSGLTALGGAPAPSLAAALVLSVVINYSVSRIFIFAARKRG